LSEYIGQSPLTAEDCRDCAATAAPMSARMTPTRKRVIAEYNHEVRARLRALRRGLAVAVAMAERSLEGYRVAAATRTPGNRLRSCTDAPRASSRYLAATSAPGLKTSPLTRCNRKTWTEDTRIESLRRFPATRRARRAPTRPPRGMPSAASRATRGTEGDGVGL
jgi:hypothetical protein